MAQTQTTYKTFREAIEASGYQPRNDGVECETWTGLVADPLRPRARRKRVTIWRHPDVWPVEDCSRRAQTCSGILDGPVCSKLPRGPGREWPPPIWRIGNSGSHTYCDGCLPERFRALVTGQPVMQRYIHPHDKPCCTAASDGGWIPEPPHICY